MAKTVEELPVFQKALEFCVAVNALLERPAFGKQRDLREEINDASDSITSNMREGFEQSTDDHFAKYLYTSKGSVGEVLDRMGTAHRKRCITAEELKSCRVMGEALGKMLGGFIKYLTVSGFKDRGRYKAKQARKSTQK
jgi:four helix bundle protein